MSYHGPLTAHEVGLVRFAAQGLTMRQAADRLDANLETTKAHWRFIRSKLNVRTAAHAVARAYENGLLP